MKQIRFDAFYDSLHSFGEIIYNDTDLIEDGLKNAIRQNPWGGIKTALKLWCSSRTLAPLAMEMYCFPRIALFKNLGNRLYSHSLETVVGLCFHRVAPLALARKLPRESRSEIFSAYAKTLSLPNIASVIEASLSLNPTPRILSPEEKIRLRLEENLQESRDARVASRYQGRFTL